MSTTEAPGDQSCAQPSWRAALIVAATTTFLATIGGLLFFVAATLLLLGVGELADHLLPSAHVTERLLEEPTQLAIAMVVVMTNLAQAVGATIVLALVLATAQLRVRLAWSFSACVLGVALVWVAHWLTDTRAPWSWWTLLMLVPITLVVRARGRRHRRSQGTLVAGTTLRVQVEGQWQTIGLDRRAMWVEGIAVVLVMTVVPLWIVAAIEGTLYEPPSWALIAVLYVAGVIVHEAIHGIAFRLSGAAWRDLRFGASLRDLTVYAQCRVPIPVRRYRAVGLAPFLILGGIPTALAPVFDSGTLTWMGAFMTATGAGDVLMVARLHGLPRSALVIDDHLDRGGARG